VGARAAWAEAGVLARAVVPGASATVEVAADLLRGGRGWFWTSRGDPGSLGWPFGIKKGTVGGGVGWGEAMLASGMGTGLACTSESSGIKLWVNLSPGGKLKPCCLLPKGDIIGQAGAKVVLHIAGGNDIKVGYEVRALKGCWEAKW